MIKTTDVCPVSHLAEVAFDEFHSTLVVELVPCGDRLSGKTAVFNAASSGNHPRLVFRTTLGEEPEVEVALV